MISYKMRTKGAKNASVQANAITKLKERTTK
jgi:hypothetical protein